MRKLEAATHIAKTRGERGAVSFLISMFLLFLIFIGVGALALDLSQTANRAQELQSASDAAALAGVVEYEQELITLLAGGTDLAVADQMAKDAAKIVVDQVLAQNGVDYLSDSELDAVISYPEGGGRLNVSIVDSTISSILGAVSSGTLGFDQQIQRDATAEFLGCEACEFEVEIPKPPGPVQARGSGDGYKPIPVGDRLYALNHNDPSGPIVCIDILESEPCWIDVVGTPPDFPDRTYEDNRPAYLGVLAPPRSPEMPLAGVVGNTIYWSASTSSGHYLYCYNTDDDPLLDAPCTSYQQLSTSPRGIESNMPSWPGEDQNDGFKDENRGGGTAELDDKIFVFTDNHEIHCWDPLAIGGAGGFCAGYNQRPFGGMPTGLDVFPDGDPAVGNHGSSIDRVVDENTGYIYSTIHIMEAVESHDCSTYTAATTVDDLIDEIVVIENAGRFLAATSPDVVSTGFSATDRASQWRVIREDPADPYVYLESLEAEEWLDGEADLSLLPVPLGTDSTQIEPDNQWVLTFDTLNGGFTIENVEAATSFVNINGLGSAVQDVVTPATIWTISSCEDLARDAGYAPGTWLHCYDTGVVSGVRQPCPDFDPGAPLHPDASRYSGRLFFHYESAIPGIEALKLGVCSTGYVDSFAVGVANTIEVNCVSMLEGLPTTADFSELADRIDALVLAETNDSPRAWGDPHYNEYQNRLFYPTDHRTSWNLCWDFNTGGLCGPEFRGDRPSPTGSPYTEDYGFYSKDNCVFALGHTAYFWTFQADDVTSKCVGATTTTIVERCPCTGLQSRWGLLDFTSLDLTIYDRLEFQITTNPPNPEDKGIVLWPGDALTPPRDRWHTLTPTGDSLTVPLDAIDAIDPTLGFADNSIRLEFYVEAENTDPFDEENLPQGKLKFQLQPRLIE